MCNHSGVIRLPKRLLAQSSSFTRTNPIKLSGRFFEEESRAILKNLGFSRVRILGKTCDNGIDGEASYTIGDFIQMKFAFQCKGGIKRVSSPQIREFVGSISGSYAAGLFFSASGFTREARTASVREDLPQIYLIGPDEIRSFYSKKYIFRT